MDASIERFRARSRTIFVPASVLTVLVIGVIDYAANPEISFAVFYLLAVGMAAWFVGRAFAYFISALSVAVSLAGDLASSQRYTHFIVPFWNSFIVLVFYLVVVWLLGRLRLLTRSLEQRVEERTTALRDEINERERAERELLEISEREQRRIGHDLHDSLGQHLTGAALASQVLKEKLESRRVPEAAGAGKVVELIEEGIALTRKLAKGLHPVEMEADGLMLALEELASNTTELFKVACRFECDSPVLIRDAAASKHMYRIAQEAISNAVKHGGARRIIIQLEALDDGIALRVKDDGVGLPESPPKTDGMGLRIMAHRAGMIGASFEAHRDQSGGTLVSCVLHHRKTAKGSHD